MQHAEFKLKLVKSLLLVVMGLTLFSQASFAGGDTYTIYLNKTLILKQFVLHSSSDLISLPLEKANPNDQLIVYYSHCGVTGKGRNIVVRNEQNQVLKEWKFADASGSDASMTIAVKDIIDLKKKNPNSRMNLYYSSSELMPKGLMLAAINLGNKDTAIHPAENKLPMVYASAILAIALYPIIRRKAS